VRLRPGFVAALALVAAVIGGAAVLVAAKATGWVGKTTEKTVVVSVPRAAQPVASEKPLPLTMRTPSGATFQPSRIYRLRAPGVVTIYAITGSNSLSAQEAQGSGFVVSGKGYILTNSHVITNAGEGAKNIKAADHLIVEFRDRDRVPATVVGWDVYDDVGLIKVDPNAHPLAPVPLGRSASAVVGEPVAAIGSPFGNVSSLSVGVVSATHRSINSLTAPNYNLVDAIQTDAPINHGNSGGPLFDAQGRVIGINAQIRSDSGNGEGVGFAVPIDSARRSMLQLIASGRVSYAFVGIESQDLIPSVAKKLGYAVGHGAIVTHVRSGTPGAQAGFHAATADEPILGSDFGRGGDVIVAIDGHPVQSAEDVVRVVTTELSPGETARFTFYRGSSRRTVSVKLAQRPTSSG
jgi:2-alkenal reductase